MGKVIASYYGEKTSQNYDLNQQLNIKLPDNPLYIGKRRLVNKEGYAKASGKAVFTKDGNKTTAYYNAKSRLVAIASPRKFSNMPYQAQGKIKTLYNGYTVVSVLGFNNNSTERGRRAGSQESYLVELSSATDKIIVKVNIAGEATVLKEI